MTDSTHPTGSRLVDNGADFDPGITTPNGGWNAPAEDLARYVAFLTNTVPPDGTRAHHDTVLKRSSIHEMWQPVVPMTTGYQAATDQHMGLSFLLLRRGTHQLIGHTGSQAGFRSFLYFNATTGTAVIVAFNTTSSVNPATTPYAQLHEAALNLLH
ncbi:hypothetical protein BH23GEM9_BH23GEM9_00260 [soil metagenome]